MLKVKSSVLKISIKTVNEIGVYTNVENWFLVKRQFKEKLGFCWIKSYTKGKFEYANQISQPGISVFMVFVGLNFFLNKFVTRTEKFI